MSLLANRLSKIKPSATLAVSTKAKELKDKGVDIISLAAGEPDFDTPLNIKQAAIKGIKEGNTKYTPVTGTTELRQAVCNKFQKENGLSYNTNEVIVSTGGKQVIYNLFMATLNEGDEVIIPAPYWVSYPDMVLLSGANPIIVKSDIKDNFKPKLSDIENAITPKTKWLILNSPSNPSGAIYDKEYLLKILELAKKYPHLHIMTDDIYEHIIFDEAKFFTIASLASEEIRKRIFIVNGVSKAYSMTGWRIGYGAGDESIIKAMSIIQSQSTSNPSSISQVAALEALSGDQKSVLSSISEFQEKRDLVISLLSQIKELDCYKPSGAFYLFPKCSQLFGKKTPKNMIINSSAELATYLLEKANVAVVPGVAFGMDEHFRISYATSKDLLKEACLRIKNAISELS
ncbi:MAG TPA: pyridoxal phosphate-dependent aminotransferase [Candidatus Megaira endosymbiont of Nemacystus decipiens]|nr:pyridoxal phosphate-dependent aminotransferase [Candidatus Megaera endosymbiont of Nemacystus decipiens]